jgi:hypothetical protein
VCSLHEGRNRLCRPEGNCGDSGLERDGADMAYGIANLLRLGIGIYTWVWDVSSDDCAQ